MVIRQAEPRDIHDIYPLFLRLIDYLKEKGNDMYARDLNEMKNGVMGYIIGVFHDENHLVLVKEGDQGEVNAFLIGRIIPYYPFFEHKLWGEIMATFPLSLNTRFLARKFEEWAIGKGATGTGNYSTPGNDIAASMFVHEGREKVWEIYFRPFTEADYESLHQDRLGHGNGGGSRKTFP